MAKVLSPSFKQALLPPPTISAAIPNLAETLAKCSATFLEQDEAQLLEKLNKHIGRNATYTNIAQLIDSLSQIYVKLTDPDIDRDQKRMIAEKLMEEIENCTAGFHNRVNNIILGFTRPKTLDEFLEIIRTNLVDTTARQHTSEVHAHNRFFLLAVHKKYGIRAINQSDAYRGDIDDQQIISALNKAFMQHYHPLAIVPSIFDIIESELHTYQSYCGRKTEGYEAGDYNRMLTFLKSLFQDDNLSIGDAFILDEDSRIIDLNLPYILSRLWTQFAEGGYFELSPTENLLFYSLFMHEFEADIVKASLQSFPKIFDNVDELIPFLELFTFKMLPDSKKIAFLEAKNGRLLQPLLNDYKTWKKTLAIILSIENENERLLLLKPYFDILITNVRAYPEMIKTILSGLKEFKTEEQTVYITELYKLKLLNLDSLIIDYPHLVAPALLVLERNKGRSSLVTYLSTQLYSDGNTALILAAKHGKADVISLLLDYDVPIESRDINQSQSTALHWAANNGHTAAVTCLLEKGADLEAKSLANNTPLNFAVRYGRDDVVKLLLAKGAKVNARNKDGKNALNISIESHPEFIAPILMQLATLPMAEQTECLPKIPPDIFPNVLFYAAAKQPELFSNLIDKILQEHDSDIKRHLLTGANNRGYTPLILAAQLGDHESIRKLLESGLVNIESQDLNSSRALHWAASNGHTEAVNCLLEKGADLEAKGWENNTPLHFAVRDGRDDVVKLLLNNSAKVNARNDNRSNALDLAIEKHPEFIAPILMQLATLPMAEQTECLSKTSRRIYPNVLFYAAAEQPQSFSSLIDKILQEPDSDINRNLLTGANDKGYTPLILAAQLGDHKSIRKLLESGLVNIESQDLNSSRALHWAATNGHTEAVNCLLEKGADLEAKGWENNTPLNFAIIDGRGLRGQALVVKLLLDKSSKINARNHAGKNALDLAIEKNRPEVITPILMQLATLPMAEQTACLSKVSQGIHPNVLFYAAANKPELFGELIDRILQVPDHSLQKAILNASGQHGYTPLMLAVLKGDHESIRKLLGSGLVDIESQDLYSYRALHLAASCGYVEDVTCLLEKGADLEARDRENNTTLNIAVNLGRYDLVELLLDKSSKINARNNAGKNALDLAIQKNRPEFITPILMKLATLPMAEQTACLSKVSQGIYPNVLFYAAANKPELFGELIDRILQEPSHSLKQAIFNASDQHGYTPLILAAQRDDHKSIRKLLESGLVNIESQDLNSSRALHWAASNGHKETVTYLLEKGADLEAKGWANNTPLNFAVINGRTDVVKLLLDKGAKVNARNKDGKNALDLSIERHPEFIAPILMKLTTLPIAEQTECLSKLSHGIYSNVFTYAAIEKPHLLEQLIALSNQSKKDTQDIKRILATMHFDEHMQCIREHYLLMQKKSLYNPNYTAATNAAKTLLMECVNAKVNLFHQDGAIEDKIRTFQETVKSNIKTAKPVLETHREWAKVLAAFLLAIITFPVSVPLYAMGFFSLKTKSMQIVDKLHSAVVVQNMV